MSASNFTAIEANLAPTFTNGEDYRFEDYTFNTEPHPFKRSNFDKTKAKKYLGM